MEKKEDKRLIKFGSPEHAALIGLVADKSAEGYHLADETAFGPNATDRFLSEILRQKIAVLKTPPTVPADSPILWTPDGNTSGMI